MRVPRILRTSSRNTTRHAWYRDAQQVAKHQGHRAMQDTPNIHPLHAMIREICGSPEAERFGALSSACLTLGGTVIQPGSTSHMHEISVLGVYARAAGRQEPILNWLRSARALHVALTESSAVADQKPPPAIRPSAVCLSGAL